jgi:lysophospholipase L1-like esterase
VLCFVELAAWLVEMQFVAWGVIYDVPDTDGYEEYLAARDPVLGWPPPGAPDRDPSGSRPVPAFPDSAREACVSIYGDSFTFGMEVSDEAAWGNVLAEELGCRVSNYGVASYGTDQAYLRFRSMHKDRSPYVILGHLSENVLRNVTRYLQFLYPHQRFSLKPRFVLGEDDELELIPIPELSYEEFRELATGSGPSLAHEDLEPGTAYGRSRGGFPHALSLFHAATNERIRARLAGQDFWDDFYRENHPSRALPITRAILRAFAAEALAEERVPVVAFFALPFEVRARQRGETFCYGSLADALRAEGLLVADIGEALVKHLERRDPESLFAPSGIHLNEEGNRVAAGEIARVLREAGRFARGSADPFSRLAARSPDRLSRRDGPEERWRGPRHPG